MNQNLLFVAVVGAVFVVVLVALVAAYQVTHPSIRKAARPALLQLVFKLPFAVAVVVASSGSAVAHVLGWLGPGG